MITTRRNVGFGDNSGSSAIDVLERKNPVDFESATTDNFDVEREKMHRNLNRLLYGETEEQDIAETDSEKAEEISPEIVSEAKSDEDIRPTSTTMQFGDGEISHIYNDLEKQKDQEKNGYKLNARGKLVVVLYALAVMVILALIVINTGVLASLKRTNQAMAEELDYRIAQYNAITEEINSVSADEYVISVAENTFGMIKGN